MKKKLLIDEFLTPADTNWRVIDETLIEGEKKVVDGKYILARVSGPAFLVNGTSINKRFYTESLWRKTIEKVNKRLESGGMLGAVGHNTPLTDEELAKGNASHRVSKLWIDEKTKVGMIEILVLNTTSGANLNTYLRSGTKFPVSSRAFGEYVGKTDDGADIVDEDTFELETFDFVRNPGVPIAYPQLVESNKNLELSKVDHKQLIESVTAEKVKLQQHLESVLEQNNTLKLKVENSEHKSQEIIKENESLKEQLASVKEEVEEAKQALSQYKEIGEVEDIKIAFEAAEDFAKKFKKFESIEAVQKNINLLKEYQKLGKLENLAKVLDEAEKYMKIGTVESIQAAFKLAKNAALKFKEDKFQSEAQNFAKQQGVPDGIAEKLLKAFGNDEAKTVLEELKNADSVYDRYKVKSESGEKSNSGEVKKDMLEESNSTVRLYDRYK